MRKLLFNSNLEKGLSGNELKLIAIFAMFLQHLAYCGVVVKYYNFLEVIGRLTFPIIIFLLVEGLFYTKSIKKYLFRLAIFALISEIPYRLAFGYSLVEDFHIENIFMTLLLSLFMGYLIKLSKGKILFSILIFMFCAILANILQVDYNVYALMLTFVFVEFRENFVLRNLFFYIIFVTRYPNFILGILILIIISSYNGKRTNLKDVNKLHKGYNKIVKYLFYLFYPVHLIFIYVIKMLIS